MLVTFLNLVTKYLTIVRTRGKEGGREREKEREGGFLWFMV